MLLHDAAAALSKNGVRLCRAEVSAPTGDDIFLVGLLDGTLNAIDPETGAMLWRYDSGSPMVSVQTLEWLIPGQRATPTFFPGADGGLYHYNSDGGNLEVCRAPATRANRLLQSQPLFSE